MVVLAIFTSPSEIKKSKTNSGENYKSIPAWEVFFCLGSFFLGLGRVQSFSARQVTGSAVANQQINTFADKTNKGKQKQTTQIRASHIPKHKSTKQSLPGSAPLMDFSFYQIVFIFDVGGRLIQLSYIGSRNSPKLGYCPQAPIRIPP